MPLQPDWRDGRMLELRATNPPDGLIRGVRPALRDQPLNAAITSSSIFLASPNSMRLFSL